MQIISFAYILVDKGLGLIIILHTIYKKCILSNQRSEPKTSISAVVEAALTYHLQVSARDAKGKVPVEVAAFIAGACWVKEVLKTQETIRL
jgi:hypothetical protein